MGSGMEPTGPTPPRVLVRAAERGPESSGRHPYNPRSQVHGWTLSRMAGLGRIAVNLAWLPPGNIEIVDYPKLGMRKTFVGTRESVTFRLDAALERR
jgi:hypothetical protein